MSSAQLLESAKFIKGQREERVCARSVWPEGVIIFQALFFGFFSFLLYFSTKVLFSPQ
jgi:hypothetical protein